ncbi:hypothetical protein D9611_011018 [Ephemerocybe angulata]|uniref:Homeobox domain-containing protein n=1 Tax=Ephemerocybe angulata TaxID=980116 RepID=A0A8H5BCI5_9AGAR|nr:hypothetical protein D9611_011018 [Tulosesus angulatus]
MENASEPTPPISVPKTRPNAVRANAKQVEALMAAFNKSDMISPAVLESLEKELGLTQKWICGWFSRQRTKKRKVAAQGINPSANNSLEVKKEACEAVVEGSAESGPQKKRKAKATSDGANTTQGGKKKKAKTLVVEENSAPLPTAPGSAVAPTNGMSLRDKIMSVKTERYTPVPDWSTSSESEGQSSTSKSTAAGATSRHAATSKQDRPLRITLSGPGVPAMPLAKSISAMGDHPVIQRFEFSNTQIPASESDKIGSASRKQNRFYNKDARHYRPSPLAQSISSDPLLPKAPGQAELVSGLGPRPPAIGPMPYQLVLALSVEQYPDSSSDAVVPSNRMALAENTLAVDNERNWLVGPHRANEIQTEDSGQRQETMAQYPSGFNYPSNESTNPAGITSGRPTTFPSMGSMKMYDPKTGKFLPFIDPMHAPMKHLSDIMLPVCDSVGGYENLGQLGSQQKQEVIEQLLNEDLEKDPFKATMGLNMAYQLGLRW